MNKLFANTYQSRDRNGSMGAPGLPKKGLPYQNESLFGMALYDFDTLASDVGFHTAVASLPQRQLAPPPVFHPVDEYKDLSLKEILDLSDDFLSGDDDQLMQQELNLDPTPFAAGSAPALVGSSAGFSQTNSLPFNNNNMEHKQLQAQQSQLAAASAPATVTPTKKRSRDYDEESDSEDGESEASRARRFRPYQAGQWSEKFSELCDYKDKMGHCLVPHTFHENLALARWVKRQRYQYKLMMDGKASTMTPDRVKALEDIGFVWDSQGAAWGERLGELREFRGTYMHCNVPSNFSENPRLATWIKCQRRQYKLYMEGKPSNMTTQRIQHLESLGFEWELRTYKKQRTTAAAN